MALHYGNPIGSATAEAAVWCRRTGWTALQTGSSPLSNRQWLEIQVKGPTALALGFVNKAGDGTFTAPADDTRNHMVIPASSIKVIPVGDGVTVYGRTVAKAGSTAGGSKVIVVEFR